MRAGEDERSETGEAISEYAVDNGVVQKLTDVISDVEAVRNRNMDNLNKTIKRSLLPYSESTKEILKKKEDKILLKKYAQSAKVKNANKNLLYLLAETLAIVPYLNDAQCGGYATFIGKFLVYNDEQVATAASHALQRMVKESLKGDIMIALTSHVYTRVKNDNAGLVTLLDNLTILIQTINTQATTESVDISIDQAKKRIIDMSWLEQVENVAMACLCCSTKSIRISALRLIDICGEYISTIYNPTECKFCYFILTISVPKPVCCSDMIRDNALTIIQKALLTQRPLVDFEKILTIEDIAFKEEWAGLWMIVVGWIGRIAVDNNITGFYNLLLDRIGSFGELAEMDENVAYLWGNTLSMICGAAGGSNVNKVNFGEVIRRIQPWRALQNGISWARVAVTHAVTATHLENSAVLLGTLHDYMQLAAKSKIEPKKHVLFLMDVARICGLVENNAESAKHCSAVLRAVYDGMMEYDLSKFKTVEMVVSFGRAELYISEAIFKLADSLFVERPTVASTLQQPVTTIPGIYQPWAETDRLFWIEFLQRGSHGNASENRKQFMANALNRALEKVKVQEVRQKCSDALTALDASLHDISQSAINRILWLHSLPFADNADTRVRMAWFERCDINGNNCLSAILNHNFATMFGYYLENLYSQKDDRIIQVYARAIHDLIIPPSIPKLPKTTVELVEYMKRKEVFNKERTMGDDRLTTTLTERAISILCACLYLLSHPTPSIHSNSHEILFSLAQVNFLHHINYDEQTYEKKILPLLGELELLQATFKTRSLNHTYVSRLSTILSNLFPNFATTLFHEAFNRNATIQYFEKRSPWLMRALVPWSKTVDSSGEFVLELFNMSLAVFEKCGMTDDLRQIWQNISLQDNEGKNLLALMNFLKWNCCNSASTEALCRELCVALFVVQPKDTVKILVLELRESRAQEIEQDFAQERKPNLVALRVASIAMLSDIVCECGSDMSPIFIHLSIIIPYVLVYMNEINHEDMPISPGLERRPLQTFLLNLLLRIAAQVQGYYLMNTKYNNLITLLQTNISLSWLTVQSSTLRQTVVDMLPKSEPCDLLLPYSNHIVDAGYIVGIICELIDYALDHEVVISIANSALTSASLHNETMLRYLVIFGTILEPINDNTVSIILGCVTTMMRSTCSSRQYVTAMTFLLSVLRSTAFSSTDMYKSILWSAIGLLQSGDASIYKHALDVVDVYRQRWFDQVFVSNGMEKNIQEFTAGWAPEFEGLQPLLLRGVNNKDTEAVSLQLVLALAYTPPSKFVDITARRFLTTSTLLFPILYRQILYNAGAIIGENTEVRIKNSQLSFGKLFGDVEKDTDVSQFCEILTILA